VNLTPRKIADARAAATADAAERVAESVAARVDPALFLAGVVVGAVAALAVAALIVAATRPPHAR